MKLTIMNDDVIIVVCLCEGGGRCLQAGTQWNKVNPTFHTLHISYMYGVKQNSYL